jgi:8-oxo-dGTP diphosphatase
MKKTIVDFPHPFVSVDCVFFGFDEGELRVLLIARDNEPFKGYWALPGGFIDKRIDKDADACAVRKLKQKTGIDHLYIKQFYTFSDRDRDERWVVSIAYFALVKRSDYRASAGTYTSDVKWFTVSDAKELDLAFDHKMILNRALEELKRKIRYQPIGFELLSEKFTMPDLHHLYEAVTRKNLDRRNFRKKILSAGLLIDHNELQEGMPHKAPKIYSFDCKKYEELLAKGFNFEL